MRLRHAYTEAEYDAGIALALLNGRETHARILADLRDAAADRDATAAMLAADDTAAHTARAAEKADFDTYFDGAP